jgi:iron complex transport system substrate-binding protein
VFTPPVTPHRPTRVRRRSWALAVLAAAVLAGGCGGSSESGSSDDRDSSEPSSEAWSYTDSTGTTVELESAPETIVAETTIAGGLWELGITAKGTFGLLHAPDGSPSPSIGLADPDLFTSLGEEYGQINLEQMASLQPDLIITPSWEDGTYWGIEDDMVEQVQAIAPIVGVAVTGRPIDEVLAEVDELAQALGADTDSTEVAAARQSFTDASEELAAATAANPDLRVLAASGTPDQFYVAVPENYPDLSYYQSLGLNLVVPDTDEEFWQTLSWEEVDMYPADMIMGDSRGGTPEQLLAQMPPNARELAAIQQDQLVSWQLTLAMGYGAVARAIEELAGNVRDAVATS